MPKIKEITDARVKIYPRTIPQAVIDPVTGLRTSDRLDALEIAGATITLTANPSVIGTSGSTNVVLSVSVSGLGTAGADLIEILNSSSEVIASGSGSSLSTTVSLSAAATFTARVTHGTATKSVSRSISVVGTIYYGSGSSDSDFQSNKVAYPTPTASVARTYDVTVRNAGDYVYFYIPSSMTINNVTLGGFGFPMTLQSTSGDYKLYRSDNTYLAGTLQLVVS